MTILRLDRAVLDRLIDRFETLRARDGMGNFFKRVTPLQRIDALQICVAAYASGRVPKGDQKKFWLAHLRPILAETPEAAAALSEALEGLLPTEDILVQDQEIRRSDQRNQKSRFAGWLLSPAARRASIVFGAVLVLSIMTILLLPPSSTQGPVDVSTTNTFNKGGFLGTIGRPFIVPDRGAMNGMYQYYALMTVAALDQYGDELTPHALAAAFSGSNPELGQPAGILAAMLRKVPLDPFAPIPRSPVGAFALRQFAAIMAATTLGQSTASFEQFTTSDLLSNRPGDQMLQRFVNFGSGKAGPTVKGAAIGPPTWPWWSRSLPFLMMLPFVVWIWRRSGKDRSDLFAKAFRENLLELKRLRRAANEEWGKGRIIQTSASLIQLQAPASISRKLLRMRELQQGKRLDPVRSVNASILSSGDIVAVMRPTTRTVDIVFLVHRRHRHDHERARILRILESLSRAGVNLTAYDYAPDPRSISATSRADAFSTRERPRTLNLRGLRELHSDAMLVIVSDGQELIDPFSQKPYAFVREELRTWPRRILLTPMPVVEWGEREMQLSVALDAMVGRASMAGLDDLDLGLSPEKARTLLKRTLPAARLSERVSDWSAGAASLLSKDLSVSRPPPVVLDGMKFSTELEPPRESIDALLRSLKGWLGPGFLWFAACGIYPHLRVDLTLWLGSRLRRYGYVANPPIFTEEIFDRLCLLPWFRDGRFPEWLRRAAVDALSPREKLMALDAIRDLFVRSKSPPDGRRFFLQVWQSDWRGQSMKADDVMLEIGESNSATAKMRPDIEIEAASKSRTAWLARSSAKIVAATAWCACAWFLWPDPSSTPHPQGAWWPLAVFILVSVALFSAAAAANYILTSSIRLQSDHSARRRQSEQTA